VGDVAGFYVSRVVVFEEDAAALATLIASLRELGRWTVHVAKSADEVVTHATRYRPHVIVLGGSGQALKVREVVAKIQAIALLKLMPIVYIGDGSSEELADLVTELGARGGIRKPVDVQALPDQIRKAVGAELGTSPDFLFRGT